MKLQFIHIRLSIPYFWKSRFCNEGENSPRQFHRMARSRIGLRFRLVQHQYNLLISLVKIRLSWEITMSDDWIRWEWQKLTFLSRLVQQASHYARHQNHSHQQTVIHSWLRLSERNTRSLLKGQLLTGIECNRRRNAASASTIFSPESGYSSNTRMLFSRERSGE